MTNRLLYAVLAAGAYAALGTADLVADPGLACGDVLTRTITLQSDVELGCGDGVALTIVGPARLDLNGFQLSCSDDLFTLVNIELVGSRARIGSGSTEACQLRVAGDGRHIVDEIRLRTGDASHPLEIHSDRNIIRNVDSFGEEVGLAIFGNTNLISNTYIGGIVIALYLRGDHNRITHTVIGTGTFEIGGKRNMFSDVSLTGSVGIDIDGERQHIFRSDLTDDLGIGVRGDHHRIVENTIRTENLRISGNRHTIIRNTFSSRDGQDVAIRVLSGSTRNALLGNHPEQGTFLHLHDENEDCDRNIWRHNEFESANQSCIN
jgi:hypothetical protein